MGINVMRHSELRFRPTKHDLHKSYEANLSFDGKPLRLYSRTPRLAKSSLGRSKRFTQYEVEARRTCDVVGPGSYDVSHRTIGRSRVRGGPKYTSDNEKAIGDLMVLETSFMPASIRGSEDDLYSRVYQTLVKGRTDRSTVAKEPADLFPVSKDPGQTQIIKDPSDQPSRTTNPTEQPSIRRPSAFRGSSRPRTSVHFIRLRRSHLASDDLEFDRSIRRLLDESPSLEKQSGHYRARSSNPQPSKSLGT
jgi:hypothetical protein